MLSNCSVEKSTFDGVAFAFKHKIGRYQTTPRIFIVYSFVFTNFLTSYVWFICCCALVQKFVKYLRSVKTSREVLNYITSVMGSELPKFRELPNITLFNQILFTFFNSSKPVLTEKFFDDWPMSYLFIILGYDISTTVLFHP